MVFDNSYELYKLTTTNTAGGMPSEKLEHVLRLYCKERTVGVTRLYAAKGANEQIDKVIRTWADPVVKIGMHAIDNDGDQYIISAVQTVTDLDGLKYIDITLTRLGSFYEVII